MEKIFLNGEFVSQVKQRFHTTTEDTLIWRWYL